MQQRDSKFIYSRNAAMALGRTLKNKFENPLSRK